MREGRKKARSNKAITFPKKKELPRVGLEPTTLYTLDRALYHMYKSSEMKFSPNTDMLIRDEP